MNGEIIAVQDRLVVTEKEIQQLKYQYDMFRKLQQVVLEENVDYGFPAGKKSQDQKPSLYKSGAEKLTRLFNLIPEFELIKQVEEQDFIMYAFKCRLHTPTGQLVGEGYGACNSREKQGWNANPWVFQNNILKIAKKRSHVDAVLTGLGASNVFTQDLEDQEEEKSTKKMNEKQLYKEKTELWQLIKNKAKEIGCEPEDIVKEVQEKFDLQTITGIRAAKPYVEAYKPYEEAEEIKEEKEEKEETEEKEIPNPFNIGEYIPI